MALNGRNAGSANGDAERDPRLERLYREAAREAPPAHLDAAILAAAHREAGARPHSVTSALRRWHVPVSIAAVVILSVTLVILVGEEDGEPIVPAPIPAIALPAERPAAPADAARASEQPQLAAPAPQRQESRDDARFAAALGKLEDRAKTESRPPAPAGAAVGATPAPAARPSQEPLLAVPRLAEEGAAPPAADAVTAGRMAGARPEAGEPPVARSALEAVPAKSIARAMQAKPPEEDPPPVWHGYEKEPPQKWLARIDELKKQGRAREAQEMLSEFKRRFPEHPQP